MRRFLLTLALSLGLAGSSVIVLGAAPASAVKAPQTCGYCDGDTAPDCNAGTLGYYWTNSAGVTYYCERDPFSGAYSWAYA